MCRKMLYELSFTDTITQIYIYIQIYTYTYRLQDTPYSGCLFVFNVHGLGKTQGMTKF